MSGILEQCPLLVTELVARDGGALDGSDSARFHDSVPHPRTPPAVERGARDQARHRVVAAGRLPPRGSRAGTGRSRPTRRHGRWVAPAAAARRWRDSRALTPSTAMPSRAAFVGGEAAEQPWEQVEPAAVTRLRSPCTQVSQPRNPASASSVRPARCAHSCAAAPGCSNGSASGVSITSSRKGLVNPATPAARKYGPSKRRLRPPGNRYPAEGRAACARRRRLAPAAPPGRCPLGHGLRVRGAVQRIQRGHGRAASSRTRSAVTRRGRTRGG